MYDYTVKRLDEMEKAFGGMWTRARASLGATAFGFQVTDLPPNSGDMYPQHDHSHDGQEEVYMALGGSGEMVLPDRTVTLEPDVWVRVGADVTRQVRSGPDGLRILVIGGMPGKGYTWHPNTELGGPEVLGREPAEGVSHS